MAIPPKPGTPLWKTIAETLRAEIVAGHWRAGDRMPTEAQLAARFGVNRHTVRHALAGLGADGTVRSRRGAGVFVAQAPLADYPLGRRVRFHQNVAATGRTPSRRLLRLETRHADLDEAMALHLQPGDPVHLMEGVSLADDVPMAMFRSVFPAAHLPDLLEALRANPSVTAALAVAGVADYTRASTRLVASLADRLLAQHLQVAEGAPILRSTSINLAMTGIPVEFGTTWFAGDRVALTLQPEDPPR